MALSKKTFPKAAAAAAFDPYQNFEVVTYTGNGGTQKITGYIRKGAAFNGSSSRIDLGKIDVFTGDVSVSAWISLGNTTTTNVLRPITLNAVQSGWAGTLEIRYRPSDGLINVAIGDGTSSETSVLTHFYSLTQNSWYHICVTRNGSTNVTKLYINGTEQDSETVSATATVQSNAISVIGNQAQNYSPTSWNGKIDQVRIFNKALSLGEVTTLKNETYASSTKSTTDIFGDGSGVALYELDEDANDTGGTYNGTATNVNFLGMAFQPDFVWIKPRSANYGNIIYDSVRGTNKRLFTYTTTAEVDDSPYALTSFDSNGFTVADITNGDYGVNGAAGGAYSGSDAAYVAWCWKAGGAATDITSNSSGVSSAYRSVNADAGFSIVKYTANSTSQSFPHGLNQTPELHIIKRTSSPSDWLVFNTIISGAGRGFLNLTNQFDNIGVPTYSSTDISNIGWASGDSAISYCFHSVTGYQKIGSYTGNGSSSGQTITGLGFNPRFLLVKNATNSAAWRITDKVRGDNIFLYPNSSSADDSSSGYISLITDGFRMNGLDSNTSDTFIYLAIK